ncbi:Uncharacterized protein SCF082_LOCUS11750 [Durusdinium trenchii]|uniref:Uncharacterized protein n=1 Tax=Durusdinium trenchii TaxID=1381693 RepID=A0ABP0JF43_9DINO
MPWLPDGTFARGEKDDSVGYSVEGNGGTHASGEREGLGLTLKSEFWAKYDGYGCMAFEVGETGFSVLHKAAAFGWPQQARFLLAKNPEMVESRTSAGRSAREIAESAVAWCLAKGRKEEEQQHREVAELCHSAERGETIAFKLGPT